ncbi:CdaR family transcriptional regulator [Pseudonocardia sp. WMMC193]|uniref:PucR family transcriptional regulator n=1 Tax=Pseudonocardia sp. WMMC193 TaxID=2911965 RepID=UPI001F34FD7C|nr:PucR family transcriptional regulator [Pseudonocardia sp. WMMC193]MCF7548012.1 helix-turn-helix domain-containing protein [Pseudonocardia sp. WMMC193]
MASPTTTPVQDVADGLALVLRAVRAELGPVRCAVHVRRPDGGLAPVASAGERGGHTSAAVPLLVEGEVAGVLEIERAETPSEGRRDDDAGAAAPYAALAESILAREREALRGARQRRELAELGRCRTLQRRLAAEVAAGAEGRRLVELLAELLGTEVAWLDAALRPVAGRGVLPGTAHVRTALDGLGPNRASMVLPPAPDQGLMRRHVVAALVGEGEVCGFLDVVETGRRLGQADAQLAEWAAGVLALQTLSESRRAEAVVQARDDVLGELVRGSRAPEDLARMAAHVGIAVDRPHVLVRLPVAKDREAREQRAAVAALVGGPLGPVLAIAEPDAVILLVGVAAGAEGRVRTTLGGLLDRVAALSGVPRAIVSAVCRRVADYPAAHGEARDAEAIVAGFGGRSGVVDAADFRTLRLVVNGERTSVAVRFAESLLGPLRRNDAETGGELTATLRHYLHCGAQVRATAKALGVHENTIRYRLGRIEHVGGLDLRRFDALLAAQLALQVDELVRGGC